MKFLVWIDEDGTPNISNSLQTSISTKIETVLKSYHTEQNRLNHKSDILKILEVNGKYLPGDLYTSYNTIFSSINTSECWAFILGPKIYFIELQKQYKFTKSWRPVVNAHQ